MSRPELCIFELVSPCNHKEADSRMILHANHAALIGHHFKITIRTVDTDVAVLAISLAATLGPEYDLWLAFGTGKHFRYLAAHRIAAKLGIERAQALPMFHTLLTGCGLLGVTLCPVLLDMLRRQHGIFGMHCHSLLMQC